VSLESGARKVIDPLWGEVEFRHPVLWELAQSEPVQRLQGIALAGASQYLFPERRQHTRYEHSLGVMHILSVLRAGPDEQVAGLLHDIPHTAFSHTVDIVFPNSEYNYHERFQRDIIMRSAIPDILATHGVDLKAALEPDSFPLLERPLPDICADRIDYALRDLHGAGMVTAEEAARFLEQLVPTPDGLLVADKETALWFSRLFLQANHTFWTGRAEAGAYWALAGAIRRAYTTGAFSDTDLFSTDEEAMRKLRSIDDKIVQAYLALLQPGTPFYEAKADDPYFTTHMKQRAIDPLVRNPGREQALRLSQLSDEYARELRKSGNGRSREYHLWSPLITPQLEGLLSGKAINGL
jgi:HD superfamily phosphohydrolase